MSIQLYPILFINLDTNMALKIFRLMFEEEQRLGKGFTISDERELDQILLGANRQNEIPTINNKRPLSAYNAKTNSENDR